MSKQLEQGEAGILIHRNGLLSFTVLGGVKLEGLDRLVVTLMVQVMEGNRPAVRHKLDLYNDNQTSKFARTLAGKLEVGLTVVEASLSELTDLLEAWRLAEIKKQGEEEVKLVPLTSEQESAALARLRAPGLLTRTSDQLGASGIIGEERNRMILYVAMTSRLLDSPLSVFCMARSGVGKSYLQERVAACFPDHTRLENTQFTENSFYYFGRRELSHMIVLIEDMDGAAPNTGPNAGSRRQTMAFLPMRCNASPRPTVVVVLPSPAGVGDIAVTNTSLPSGRSRRLSR